MMKNLVLLSRFSEAIGYLPAYLLCMKLVKRGDNVTTTSTGEQLNAEIERVEKLTEKYDGIIELLQPKYCHLEKPSPKWIQNLPKQYFSYLFDYNVDCIYGTLPGTAQTAIELKERLKSKVVLLAICKVGTLEQNLRTDIINSAIAADEIWSIGPDMYEYYNVMFQNESKIKHESIVLFPDMNSSTFWDKNYKTIRAGPSRKLVSIWIPPVEFFHDGVKQYSQGRDIQGYYALSTALGLLNAACQLQKVEWNIHGLLITDQEVDEIRNHAKSHVVDVTVIDDVPLIENFPWKYCLAFIVPDHKEETFNFFALTAIWLGIHTLISSHSSIGKFLLGLPCPEKFRGVVNLTGDPKQDIELWKLKINNEILSKDSDPRQWAEALSQYIQRKKQSSVPGLPNLSVEGLSLHASGEFITSITDDPTILQRTTVVENKGNQVKNKTMYQLCRIMQNTINVRSIPFAFTYTEFHRNFSRQK